MGGNKGKALLWGAAGLVLLVAAVAVVFHMIGTQMAARIEVGRPHLAALPDGVYVGEHGDVPVYVRAEVEVLDGRIEAIRLLEHANGLGGKAEALLDDVLMTQSLEIDAVSGATLSSKTILKAIENALEGGTE